MLNVTTTETGFPGKPKNMLSFILPNASGLPGLTAIFQKFILPNSLRTSLTKSASPTETPPVVIRTSHSDADC